MKGDKAQLAQLLGNLISNGIKYHGDLPTQIHVSAEKKDDEWIIAVKDNGIGIDVSQYEKIFEIFSRLHNQRDYPGTGIGLAICRRIAQRHRGRIWVESAIGKGSSFYFSIPVRSLNEHDRTGSQESASRDTVS
ncbi:sensor histidine kinase [Spartinivicinus ruber]|uniref:sensor histidine kinase n=1 Tax=Spartinivicinus ruber TaxID=2683272 RepID=UPI0013D17707|nr:ATP-binding protein [Spartinivicinus ruber]